MANGLPEILQFNPIGSVMQGQQFSQAKQDAGQQNQLRAMQLQQGQQGMQRDQQFRNELATYLQGGSDNLAALYQADPERAMQVQQFQVQQNKFAREKAVEEAKQFYAQAQGVLNSESPAEYMRILLPKVAEAWAQQTGKPVDELSGDDARAMAERAAAKYGAQAGILPEYTSPEAGQVEGEDKFFQVDKISGRTRVLAGVSPRPQKPLVEIKNPGQHFETESSKELAKLEAKAFSDVLDRGQAAQDKTSSLRAMQQNPAITGPTQDFRASANSLFADLGVPIAAEKLDQIGNLAQYKGLLNQAVLTEQLKQKGPQTESDAKRIAESFGKTTNIREANRMILNYQLAVAERETLLADMAESHREKTGSIEGWRKEYREYVRRTPLASVDPQSKRLVFWNEFMSGMKEDNPDMSDDEIMGYWRKRYGGAR